MLVVFTTNAQQKSTSEKSDQASNHSYGVAVDLLPIVMSATQGKLGYSAQLWYGYKHIRFRGLIAGFTMPDKLMGNDDFTNLETTATAVIIDYFPQKDFKGWWFGASFEMWNNSITSKIDDSSHDFNNYVATASLGYIVPVYKKFYIEPWGAFHYVLNNEKVSVGNTEYKTKKFQAEISIKVGLKF
ncbi:MAG: hypothetical protein CL663_09145 [Bacteroidetes bacterium]|nr:hypothetical protein [Bacteroidota bacterium]|tara:strand:- start:324 stop:881 length:558 start_codon:yes stop_codon:yes gene_type:complete